MIIPSFVFKCVVRRMTRRLTRVIVPSLAALAFLAFSAENSLIRADPPGLSVLMHWENSNGTTSEVFFSDLTGNLGSSEAVIRSLIDGGAITHGSYCYVHHGLRQ
jgi:hypothetical protein